MAHAAPPDRRHSPLQHVAGSDAGSGGSADRTGRAGLARRILPDGVAPRPPDPQPLYLPRSRGGCPPARRLRGHGRLNSADGLSAAHAYSSCISSRFSAPPMMSWRWPSMVTPSKPTLYSLSLYLSGRPALQVTLPRAPAICIATSSLV